MRCRLEEEVQKPEASHLVQLEQQEENTKLITAPKTAEEKAALQQTLQNKEKWTQMKTTMETRLDGVEAMMKKASDKKSKKKRCWLVRLFTCLAPAEGTAEHVS